MFERSVISHKKPIGLPRSTAPDKKILVFVARDFEHFCHRYLVYRFAGLRSRLFRSTSMVVSFLVFSLTPGALQKLRLPTGLQKNWQLVENSPPVGNGNEHWCNRLRRSKAAARIYLLTFGLENNAAHLKKQLTGITRKNSVLAHHGPTILFANALRNCSPKASLDLATCFGMDFPGLQKASVSIRPAP